MTFSQLKQTVNNALARYQHYSQRVEEETDALTTLNVEVTNLKAAQKLVQQVAEHIQQSAHKKISQVVTKCLGSVFHETAYEFTIRFERKRGKTEAKLLFVRDELEVEARSVGGGVIDVASFALRLACLVLSRPAKRRWLILDEPMRFLSKNYRPMIGQLLSTLAKEMGIRFLIVTHDPDLIDGKIIELDPK